MRNSEFRQALMELLVIAGFVLCFIALIAAISVGLVGCVELAKTLAKAMFVVLLLQCVSLWILR